MMSALLRSLSKNETTIAISSIYFSAKHISHRPQVLNIHNSNPVSCMRAQCCLSAGVSSPEVSAAVSIDDCELSLSSLSSDDDSFGVGSGDSSSESHHEFLQVPISSFVDALSG